MFACESREQTSFFCWCCVVAQIASFARVTLQLMALGAPASLLADTQRAAADEVCSTDLRLDIALLSISFWLPGCVFLLAQVRHARIAFALAAAYSDAGRPVEPGAFPLHLGGGRRSGGSSSSTLQLRTRLADVAADTVAEGCVEVKSLTLSGF